MTIKRVIIWFVSAIFLIFALVLVLYFIFVRVPLQLAESAAQTVRQALNFTPEVRIDDYVVIEQSSPIAELATISRHVAVESHWVHTWLGSTKQIHLKGVFLAKAGFDLRKRFTIQIKQNPLRLYASMPRPELLSVELERYDVVKDESGWWNRLTEQDRGNATRRLIEEARLRVQDSGLLADADSSLCLQLRTMFQERDPELIIEFIRDREG